MADQSAPAQRIVFIGAAGVGKTCLMNRMVTNVFPEQAQPTVAGAFLPYETGDEDHPLLHMWDTAGMERYGQLNAAYHRGAAAAIAVFDITSQTSFQAVPKFVTQFNQHAASGVIILVGNKCDLSAEREVDAEDIVTFAKKNEYPYFEVSAKSGTGIGELMSGLLGRLPEVRDAAQLTWVPPQPSLELPPEPSRCC